MKIIPAIDIKDGKVVRLVQGVAKDVTVYSDKPADVAREWELAGAEIIHVVDLDAAFTGKPANLSIVAEIAKSVSAKIELGGGLRSVEAISQALDAGVARAVVGTRALDRTFLKKIVHAFGERIVVGIDASAGKVCVDGWQTKTETSAIDLAREIESIGVKTIIYTDIARDGMLSGPNVKALQEILEAVSIDVIASGGMSTIDDVGKLLALHAPNLSGCIVGKALYEHKLDLKEAIAACSQNE